MARLPLYLNTRTFTSHLCEWLRYDLAAKSGDTHTKANADANANANANTTVTLLR